MKSLNNSGIVINCISEFAASMAFIITQACPHRMGLSTSILMQHQMSIGLNGEINRIYSYLEYISNLKNSLDLMQTKRIGINLHKFQEQIKDEWWIYGTDNIKKNTNAYKVHVYDTNSFELKFTKDYQNHTDNKFLQMI